MKEKVDIEIEAFVHGAMCIAYSGRCTLSNHMTARDSNRGGCCQSAAGIMIYMKNRWRRESHYSKKMSTICNEPKRFKIN